MSTVVLDFTADAGRQILTKLATKHTPPAYVLAADVSEFAPTGSDRVKCALLSPTPMLPCHTKAATWVSYGYFLEQQSKLDRETRDKAASYLDKAAAEWQITADIDAMKAREDDLVKQASAAGDERFPVRNAAEADAAHDFLLEELASPREERSTSTSERVELARKIASFRNCDEPVKRAACLSGCYDGTKVARVLCAAVPASADEDTRNLVAKAAALFFGETGTTAQLQQKSAAELADHLELFEQPAELALSINTIEPVVFLNNGAVVKEAAVLKLDQGLLRAASRNAQTVALVGAQMPATKVAREAVSDWADEICDVFRGNGFGLEVDRPWKETTVLEFEATPWFDEKPVSDDLPDARL